MAAPAHGAFQLPGRYPPFNHQPRIESRRSFQARHQPLAVAGLADAHRGAQVGGFDKAGIAQLGFELGDEAGGIGVQFPL